MLQPEIVEDIKTRNLCSVTFFPKSCLLWNCVGKYCRIGQAINKNMAYVHCMLDTEGYKQTLRIVY